MTGQWEAYLKRIERGQAQLVPFLQSIEQYVREVVGKVGSAPAAERSQPAQVHAVATPAAPPLTARRTVERNGSLHHVLQNCFGYESFRPNQEEVCRVLTSGRDVVLVMPTGSGKSLCYQLPGIMLGGTTLVISPLIALMEDQVGKLKAFGFAADRIHSNRDRAASSEVCVQYLDGKLDFLFIAPERLRVRGFPEMLAKRRPCLVAIDEAHCISQWGHDFRPDYRTIGQHLPALRPAPVIALTATATPLVQSDIAQQLGLSTPKHLIHGFRRDNIAIEVVKVPPSARFSLSRGLLQPVDRRPAIIYTPTRRDTESLAHELRRDFASAAYHAGLDANRREEVQKDFLDGRLDVIVATIAFGMGVDKPDIRTVIHTALPGSVEGYYQEIGRAGRDGSPSRAILMHSYADRYTHDFFFERDYPDASVLAQIFDCLTPAPQPKDMMKSRSHLAGEAFDIAMEKLWIHGGAIVDYAENLSRGTEEWRASYGAQREHKMAQFEKMLSYCEVASCRMLALVRYFGDTADSHQRCGVCDFCNPGATIARRFRPADAQEQENIARILEFLRKSDGAATGRLHSQVFAGGGLDRRSCEELLGAMACSGLVEVANASFEKDGKHIDFRKVRITACGREPGASAAVRIPEEIKSEPRARKRKKGAKPAKAKRQRGPSSPRPEVVPQPPRDAALMEAALKSWRLAEAKNKGIPAFRILTDKALQAIAAKQPRTNSQLLNLPGVGLKIVEKYGTQIFGILSSVSQSRGG